MPSLARWIAGFALGGSMMLGQSLPGTWQGALAVPQSPQTPRGELRIVVKISTTAADGLAAAIYSIDQSGDAMTASSVTQSGAGVKFAVGGIGASYEGRLSADGNTITGTWTQRLTPMPLNLVRATAETAWTIPEPLPPPQFMPPDAKPEFEVATIKPSGPDARPTLQINRSGMFIASRMSLSSLIQFAWDLHSKQLAGAPGWIESERFDVMAKPDTPGMPSMNQAKAMLKKLLMDRFGLQFHFEKKELSVYAIEVAKDGHRLTRTESRLGLPAFGMGVGALNVRDASIAEFASLIQDRMLDRPAVDQTGLGAARWDFTLKWTPDRQGDGAPAAADNPDSPPDLFAAFQQQLGLKLQPTKTPVDVMVFDHVEKPSAN